MFSIAAIIFENEKGELLLYLRDNKAEIPFPNHWDLFGGHIEKGESPEEALVREVKEELNIELKEFTFFRKYECDDNGAGMLNIKYIFTGKINLPLEKITLLEGQRVQYFSKKEIPDVKFANVLKEIVMDYLSSGL
jgi:8-oxo-dGTP diphosphatase